MTTPQTSTDTSARLSSLARASTSDPMARMEVEGFELHFDPSLSDSEHLIWRGPLAKGYELALVFQAALRPLVGCENHQWMAVISIGEWKGSTLSMGHGITVDEAVEHAFGCVAFTVRRELRFLSALDARVWRDAEPEHAEAIAAAVEAFASRTE